MYAETIVSNGQEIAYCFNGDKLAYIVTTVEGQTITLKVNKWENNYDQAIQDKLDLRGISTKSKFIQAPERLPWPSGALTYGAELTKTLKILDRIS